MVVAGDSGQLPPSLEPAQDDSAAAVDKTKQTVNCFMQLPNVYLSFERRVWNWKDAQPVGNSVRAAQARGYINPSVNRRLLCFNEAPCEINACISHWRLCIRIIVIPKVQCVVIEIWVGYFLDDGISSPICCSTTISPQPARASILPCLSGYDHFAPWVMIGDRQCGSAPCK